MMAAVFHCRCRNISATALAIDGNDGESLMIDDRFLSFKSLWNNRLSVFVSFSNVNKTIIQKTRISGLRRNQYPVRRKNNISAERRVQKRSQKLSTPIFSLHRVIRIRIFYIQNFLAFFNLRVFHDEARPEIFMVNVFFDQNHAFHNNNNLLLA